MRLNYLAQPDSQVGVIITELLESPPAPTLITFVSAFVNRQTLLRFKRSISDLKGQGSRIRFVLGIDMNGTSKEALEELLSWDIEAIIVKHRHSGHTFHPKLFLVERADRADIVVGSNNLTEGGFFKNYEAGVHLSFDLPQDEADYAKARAGLRRFLDPQGPTALTLNPELLEQLVRRGDVPTEAEARIARGEAQKSRRVPVVTEPSPFGVEDIVSPPPIPRDALDTLLTKVRAARRRRSSQITPNVPALAPDGVIPEPGAPVATSSSSELAPTSFYMTLPKMLGPNIPGEGRIPLDAREVAEEFWGWPEHYERTTGPRGGVGREYLSWKPRWKTWDAENPDQVSVEEVRMYEYTNSSDFRFYSSALLELGGDSGDIVRITRVSDNDVEFECTLAKRGTQAYAEWINYCTEPVRNSTRRFGYA